MLSFFLDGDCDLAGGIVVLIEADEIVCSMLLGEISESYFTELIRKTWPATAFRATNRYWWVQKVFRVLIF